MRLPNKPASTNVFALKYKVPDGYNRSHGGEGGTRALKSSSVNNVKMMKLGDGEIDLRPTPFNKEEVELVNGYLALDNDVKQLVRAMIFHLNRIPRQNVSSQVTIG